MEKTKLIEARTKKGFKQQQVADYLNMDISNYNRREKGTAKVTNQEWEKLSKLFEMPIEEIYESDENMILICRDNATVNYQGNNHIYSIPEYLLEHQRKYIQNLEEIDASQKQKILILEQENKSLKSNIEILNKKK